MKSSEDSCGYQLTQYIVTEQFDRFLDTFRRQDYGKVWEVHSQEGRHAIYTTGGLRTQDTKLDRELKRGRKKRSRSSYFDLLVPGKLKKREGISLLEKALR